MLVRDPLNLAKAGLLILVQKPQPARGQGKRRRCGAGDFRKKAKALHAAAAAAATAVKGRDCPQRREIYDTSSFVWTPRAHKKVTTLHNYRGSPSLLRKKEGR